MVIEKFKIIKEDKTEGEITLELLENASESGYGNGNYLMLMDNGNENLFDARYDRRFDNEKSFRENAYQFVRDYVRPSCGVIKMEENKND